MAGKAKGKGLAKLAKTKGTKAMAKPKAAASLMQAMQAMGGEVPGPAPSQPLGRAFGP